MKPARSFDIIVLGAGAAGLMSALTAAKNGKRVLVLEKANKVGKKILMSGGGRCNFTNYNIDADNFISANPHFCKSALKRFSQWDFIAMVDAAGIAYEERKHGQLFCLNSAQDILSMLLDHCEQRGVEIRTDCELRAIDYDASCSSSQSVSQSSLHSSPNAVRQSSSHAEAHYTIELIYHGKQQYAPGTQRLTCQAIIVATGALSIPTLGGSSMGYDIAKQFGLPLESRRAGLVPFMFSDAMLPVCTRLSGLALDISIGCNGHEFSEAMLFTHRGISGPAVLQISSYWRAGDAITVDLLPDIDAKSFLLGCKKTSAKSLLKNVLLKHLAKPLLAELQALWWPALAQTALAEITDKQLVNIAEHLNAWVLKPSSTEGYRTAEVTLGGVSTDAISSKTMEVKTQPGLYFVGEVLDVSGHLGGYNFQWAWSSAYAAGCSAGAD